MDADKLSSLSQADTDEGMGEFWDTHDFTEVDNLDLPDVKFTAVRAAPIEVELFAASERQVPMIHSISLSQEVYILLQQRAQQARTSPDALAEDALRRQLGLAESSWQQAFDRLLAKVQARSAGFDPAEIEADITAAADEVKELRRARRAG